MEPLTINLQKTLFTDDGELRLSFNKEIEEGTFVMLYGKSGEGKTTLLRMLAGLTPAEKGRISVKGREWLNTENKVDQVPQKRSVGYVFQDQALFPNMNVEENVRFAQGDKKDLARLEEILEDTMLTGLRNRKPDTLSGGQRQRVALARVLAMKPELMLLDEPLSAVDRETRGKLQDLLGRLHKKYRVTTIMVSHDIPEVFKLADRVLVLEGGKVTKDGSPSSVFAHEGMSCKFKFTGEVVEVIPQDVVSVVNILIGKDLVKVIAMPDEASELMLGDVVTVASKAFSPVLELVR